jgi:hypothetical protein
MATTSETKSDLEAVLLALAEKRPVDPAVAKRVHERSAQVHIELDHEASVELLRACRDE